MKTLKIATVFSGIGAFEQALLKLNVDYDIVFVFHFSLFGLSL